MKTPTAPAAPPGGTPSPEGAINDEYEPDNIPNQATTLEAEIPQTHSISTGDSDYVTFVLSETRDVVLETSGGGGDTKLYLFDEAQNEIDYNDDGGVSYFSRIHRMGLAAGVYYAKVTSFSGTTTVPSYTLTLTLSAPLEPAPADFTLAWNNQTQSVVATWTGTPTALTYNVYYDDDSLQPYDPEQQAAEGPSPVSTDVLTQSLSGFPMGTYVYVTVRAVNAEGEEGYGTEIQGIMVPLAEDPYEADNTFNTARFIESGEPQSHSIHAPGDYDYG